MNATKYLYVIIVIFLLLTSCSSMTPSQVNKNLPTLTQSEFLKQSNVQNLVETGKCKYLVKSREYVAPVGLTVKNDLKKAARGIDEWVEIDGGNAYILRSYKWITIDDSGSTQLHVEFDTFLCE